MIYAVWLGSKGWFVRFERRYYKLKKNGFGDGLQIVMKVTKNPKLIYDFGTNQ